MLNYTEKVWGIHCSEISPNWALQRIKGLSIWSTMKKSILGSSGPKTLVDQFYYPKFGTGLLYNTMSERILANDGKVITSSYPVKIEHNGKQITKVSVNENGKTIFYNPNYLISSIPLHFFAESMYPKPPKEVFEALKKLRFRSQVYVFLILNKERVSKDNWIYYPDKDIPFGRLCEPKNFSECMSPKDKTSLFVEYFVWKGDSIWNMNEQELVNLTISELEKLKLIKKEEVIDFKIHREEFVYPVYDLNYQENLSVVMNYMNAFSNLLLIGRPGRFRYTNQDHSLEMGMLAAESILSGKIYDPDNVGAEREYFEKGSVK